MPALAAAGAGFECFLGGDFVAGCAGCAGCAGDFGAKAAALFCFAAEGASRWPFFDESSEPFPESELLPEIGFASGPFFGDSAAGFLGLSAPVGFGRSAAAFFALAPSTALLAFAFAFALASASASAPFDADRAPCRLAFPPASS
jgi:hypothetical protein